MKKLRAILFAFAVCIAASLARPVAVRFDISSEFRYRTVDGQGTTELWQNKPRLYTTDFGQQFWYADGTPHIIIYGTIKKKNWQHSLRRIR